MSVYTRDATLGRQAIGGVFPGVINKSFWPSESGATEIWRADDISGSNWVSLINGDTYARTGSGGTASAAGPPSTGMISYQHSAESWEDATPNSSIQPGTADFSIIFVARVSTGYTYVLFDYDSTVNTTEGIYIAYFTGVALLMGVHDGTTQHRTHWLSGSGASMLEDGDWHHIEMIFDKSASLVGVVADGVTQSTGLNAGSALSAVGSITPAGGLAIGAAEGGGSPLDNNHDLAYIAYAKNLTYKTPLLP